MVQFNTKNLVREGSVVYYKTDNSKEFVARFKYNNKLATQFMRFLRNNVTVASYFNEYSAGSTPMAIVRARGFI
jgi:hypothetical protein